MAVDETTEHGLQVALANYLSEKKDNGGAVSPGVDTMAHIIAHASIMRGRSLVRRITKAIKGMALEEGASTNGVSVDCDAIDEAWKCYELAQRLNPKDGLAKREMRILSAWLRRIPPKPAPTPASSRADCDVLVVGAGAAGIGVAVTLIQTFGVARDRVRVIERGSEIGESFRRWPAETRFISPSFNQQGWTSSFDLNSVARETSVAYSLHSEHLTGQEYAKYLQALAKVRGIPVSLSTEVVSVRRSVGASDGAPLFDVLLRHEADPERKITARYVVWAAGEFQYPNGSQRTVPALMPGKEVRDDEKKSDESPLFDADEAMTKSEVMSLIADLAEPRDKAGGEAAKQEARPDEKIVDKDLAFPGADLCLHNSMVRSYAGLPGDDFVIIGGYESGIDAAFNLAKAGKRATVLASRPCWSVKTVDPSSELAPYTAARLREVMDPNPNFAGPAPTLLAPWVVTRVERGKGDGAGFKVTAEFKEENGKGAARETLRESIPCGGGVYGGKEMVVRTPQAPLLCTGFVGSVRAAASHLFKFTGDEKVEEVPTVREVDNMDHEDTRDHDHDHKHDHKHGGCLAGAPLLTEHDESTKVPGVFLVGPAVSHGSLSFCFVYKFRQRFAVVAARICEGLGIDTRAAVAKSREAGMYLDDMSCCTEGACSDVC